MDLTNIAQFFFLILVLSIGLGAVAGAAAGVNISENWDENRCDPYVVPFSSWFKPAADNWAFCQTQYVQDAIATAAAVPKELAAASAGTVGLVQDITGVVADVFYDLWKFCYQTYTTFMDQMKGVAKLFHNFMINIYSIVEKLNASILSIVFGLIALIVSTINAVQITLIVTIIVVGILLFLQILLFYILAPISGLILTISVLVSVVTVIVTTAIAAATVAELFDPGACFAAGTPVRMRDGTTKPIESIVVGNELEGGGRVIACHAFWTSDTLYDVSGIQVTGDHLMFLADGSRLPVRKVPAATLVKPTWWQIFQGGTYLWCLTTSNRIIPCVSSNGSTVRFADWEEIDEEDTASLTRWHRSVWTVLNPEIPVREPRSLDADAGLAANCMVACADWRGILHYKMVRDIEIGDRVFDSPTTTTMVVGTVIAAGDQATDAVIVAETEEDGPQIISCASWVRDAGVWVPASLSISARPVDYHASEWRHLYTKSGSFMIKGGIRVRDASDVGLGNLCSLVDSIVVATESGTTI